MNCSECAQEIVHQNSGDTLLRVSEEERTGDGMVTDMFLTPQMDGEKVFCNLQCLSRWAAKQISPFTGKTYAP